MGQGPVFLFQCRPGLRLGHDMPKLIRPKGHDGTGSSQGIRAVDRRADDRIGCLGIEDGLGILLVFTSGVAAVLLPLRYALLLASVAALVMVVTSTTDLWFHDAGAREVIQASLFGATALVTGAGSGIGRATALQLAQAGWQGRRWRIARVRCDGKRVYRVGEQGWPLPGACRRASSSAPRTAISSASVVRTTRVRSGFMSRS